MIAFFLGILFLCQSHGTFSQNSTGDYPDANEVIKKLPQTFMLQSLQNKRNLICGYQHFRNKIKGGQTYRKFNLIFDYTKFTISQDLYVKNLTGYKIFMGNEPACYLMVTKKHFSRPQKRCRRKFQEHCKGPAFNYTITGCPYPKTHI
ncbi:uncharacterized protein LOC120850492 [Ixodes scapularis]|uniref:uncharacterized protein LOC120850492 n=1 Tax=Ixodes scapularis TaxID=6945 RepID=UPI001A9DFBF9|nr:uncharacterized protein LOC120850492 [Ixodes scapularis]